MKLLGEIAQKRAVYVSAGNTGKDNINILSLVPGVKTVGALNEKSGVTEYSGNNGLVSHWAQATKRFLPVKDKKDQLAGLTLNDMQNPQRVALNGSREVLIPLESVKMRPWGQGKWHSGLKNAGIMNQPLHGTSYTSPQVAAKKAEKIYQLRSFLGLGQPSKLTHSTPNPEPEQDKGTPRK